MIWPTLTFSQCVFMSRVRKSPQGLHSCSVLPLDSCGQALAVMALMEELRGSIEEDASIKVKLFPFFGSPVCFCSCSVFISTPFLSSEFVNFRWSPGCIHQHTPQAYTVLAPPCLAGNPKFS